MMGTVRLMGEKKVWVDLVVYTSISKILIYAHMDLAIFIENYANM